MYPDLLNNSHFLRYYNQWQEDPTSILFAPIAEYFLLYGKPEDAIQICLEGLKHHPQLISGRLVLAKSYIRQKEWEKVKEELKIVFNLVPNHEKAQELLDQLPQKTPQKEPEKERASWETVTMAKIYASQGHVGRARAVYQSILKREPHNEDAKMGLAGLESEA